MQVNVKLLDLNKFPEYLGYIGKVQGEEASALWKKLFVPMEKFYDFLEEISSDSKSKWTSGFIGKGHGIPWEWENFNLTEVKNEIGLGKVEFGIYLNANRFKELNLLVEMIKENFNL